MALRLWLKQLTLVMPPFRSLPWHSAHLLFVATPGSSMAPASVLKDSRWLTIQLAGCLPDASRIELLSLALLHPKRLTNATRTNPYRSVLIPLSYLLQSTQRSLLIRALQAEMCRRWDHYKEISDDCGNAR